ncbi:hypothetical protein KIN20_027816 [Parelaphostrongylus tenuis]|uniref:Uncharacterized protein n=1 Tax=Parelaphostrongylus tenuis TaxID=148309 RepID=A0AAD5R0I6_PARTN|nr:hypothetical protein KIN20_027816 [Parelaphostrongylus tenuis]
MAPNPPRLCIIVGNTVTGICTQLNVAKTNTCEAAMAIVAVPANYASISGTLMV